jgi:presenilin-like A22 family membrane protease
MKHSLNATIVILAIFLITQIFGLYLIGESLNINYDDTGTIILEHDSTTIGERPDLQGYQSFIYLVVAVIIGTILILILMKYQQIKLWKLWFFIAVFLAMSISLGVILNPLLAMGIAIILAIVKITKRNVITHNLTEILMYSGIAVLLVPIFNLKWVIILLLTISVYDAYAVWKSKHMIKMAQFQAKSEVFAGLMIPYKRKKLELEIPSTPKLKSKKNTNAILGGGDVAFSLIFSGVVMEWLVLNGVTLLNAFLQASIIGVITTISLLTLFMIAKKDKFYPAMPIITLGCLIGLGIILIL